MEKIKGITEWSFVGVHGLGGEESNLESFDKIRLVSRYEVTRVIGGISIK